VRKTLLVLCVSIALIAMLMLALMLPATARAQSLSVPITVQAAEWSGQTTAVSGTRTDAPITFGLGLPDSAHIDCPGTIATPGSAPTKLELKNGTTQLASQFRCLGKWPDGYAEWVLVDAQLPSFAEGAPGYDTSITVTQVASGGGNNPATNMAQQCTGAGTPAAACPDANHIIVQTTAATFLIKQANYNLFDDVNVGGAHLVASSNHGANDGLYLQGPPDSGIPPTNATPTIDSVSCVPTANGTTALAGSSGPIPTSYTGPSLCSTAYTSANDSSSTCTIEENGPLRAVVMCQGDMKNSSGHAYMHWRTRTHFWFQHSDAKVTVALRNADVAAGCCNTANFYNGYKEYSQFEARLTDNLANTTRNFDIANDTATSTTGTITSAQSAYLFEGHTTNGAWPHWDAAGGNNCTVESDGCVQSYIPRSGAAANRQYSMEGYEIVGTGGAVVKSGANTAYPAGWADLDDGTNGIETGVYQFSMYWPKSLEIQPGAASHNEIRVGIWPSQQDWMGATNASFSATDSTCASAPSKPCEPITSYATQWPQYQIHDTYWNFHAGTQTAAVAQNNFLYFQHYLLARPANPTYYNTVRDTGSGFDALFYDIPDPVVEDQLYTHLGICPTAAGSCVGDVGSSQFPYNGNYAGMKIFRYFGWPTAGGVDGTQFEQRESFLRNWLQRGCTPLALPAIGCGSTSLTGSVPGRYIYASHFYRMVIEKSLPRSDTATTSGASAGFRALCTSLTACNSLSFTQWGDPRAVNQNTSGTLWNGGMRNWGDDINGMGHATLWGIFDYYHLSGDEWAKEQFLQGFKDRYENPFVAFNNTQANAGGNNAPGHGHVNETRAVGHHLSGMMREVDFLRTIGDPDADNSSTVLTSPGTAPGATTVLQSAEQILASQVAIPLISGGYPKGFAETTVANCEVNGTPTNLCSQGISPIRGYPRAGGGGESCTIAAWKKNGAHSVGDLIDDPHGTVQLVTTAGTSGASMPSWNDTTGSTTTDGTVVWTSQGPGVAPCNGNFYRAADTFQTGTEAEGLYDTWQEMRKILGANWHVNIGVASESPGTAIIDGGTSLTNVTLSEKGISDALYGIGQLLQEENCVNTGAYVTSGCVYTQSLDWLNATNALGGCRANGNCLRTCVTGCNGLTDWFAIAAPAATTNSVDDLAGNAWQFTFNAQLQNSGVINQEIGSHMMQFAMGYAIANGTLSNSETVPLSTSVVALKAVPFTVTACTGAGCTHTSSGCVAGSAAGTCTISWTPPAGLCTVGVNCPPNNAPNGTQYRLKYLACQSGVLTIYGNDCPAGGKGIVPALGFRSDILTAGTVATDGYGTQVGSLAFDPAHYWNWFATTDVPDGASNTAVPSGSSYAFATQPNTTYTFTLAAYSSAPTQIYYVSSSLGADSNTNSRSTPWAHAPGDPNATGNASAHTVLPGDTFTFYGGDTWSGLAAPFTISTGGTSGSPVTYGGEDITFFNSAACNAGGTVNTNGTLVTWVSGPGFHASWVGQTVTINGVNYTVAQLGASGYPTTNDANVLTLTSSAGVQTGVAFGTSGLYCRPRLDFAHTLTCSGSGAGQNQNCAGILINNAPYVVLDDFDIARYEFANANTPTGTTAADILSLYGSVANNISITNNFIHGWDMTGTISSGSTGNIRLIGGGQIITANSCSVSDVQAAVNAASTGYTVLIPGGSCTWSTTLNISTAITLNGQGTTTITWATGGQMNVTAQASTNTFVTGITFYGSLPSGGCPIQLITSFSPLSQTLRFYGNVLDDGSPSAQGTLLCVNGTGPALLDHNTFTAHHGADEVIHINGQGASDPSGWTTDVISGGPNAVFLEDNSFVFTAQAFNGGSCSSGSPCYFWGTSAFQAYYGGRVVFRHNTVNMMQVDVHGSCSAIYGRWWEIYDNTWITIANSNQSNYSALRGGSGVFFGNTLTDGGNLVTGKIEVTEDCTSGSYPIADQIGRGISQNLSPAYIWGNSASMGILDGNSTYVQLNRDYYTSSTQPATLNFCENAANVAAGCPVAAAYTPYLYPHPLTTFSGSIGGSANTIVTGNTVTEADSGSGHYIGNGISVSGTIANNSISYTDNGFEQGSADTAPYATTLSNNHIHHIMQSTDPSNDENAIHAECYSYIYNNMIHDLYSASSTFLLEPRCNLANGTYAYYAWNNVAWNVGSDSPFIDETNHVNSSDQSNYFHYNETLVPSGASGEAAACIRADNSSGAVNEIAAFNIQCITTPARGGNLAPIICGSETTGCASPSSTVLATYVLQTPSAAAAQGYTAANSFAPTSGGATIAAGTNEESAAASALASLAADRLGVVRPLIAAWDVGAYEFVATGGPVTLAPSSYVFAPASVGSASSDSPQAFTLTNSSGATITVTSVSFIGADPGDFSETSSCGTQSNGSTCAINVTFLPTATGARSATLSVAFTGASGSPLTVSLSGTALAPIITSPGSPIIFADARLPASLDAERIMAIDCKEPRDATAIRRSHLLPRLHSFRCGSGAGAANQIRFGHCRLANFAGHRTRLARGREKSRRGRIRKIRGRRLGRHHARRQKPDQGRASR
jgi:hypothetical protein